MRRNHGRRYAHHRRMNMFGITWIARYLAWRIVDYAISLALEYADRKRRERLADNEQVWAPEKQAAAESLKDKLRMADPRPKARHGLGWAKRSFAYLKERRWGKIALSFGAALLFLVAGWAPWLLSGLLFIALGWWMIELWRRPDPEQRFEEKYGIRHEMDDL